MAIVVKMEKSTATISEEKPILSLLEVEMWLAVALSFQKIKSSLQKMENTWVNKKGKKNKKIGCSQKLIKKKIKLLFRCGVQKSGSEFNWIVWMCWCSWIFTITKFQFRKWSNQIPISFQSSKYDPSKILNSLFFFLVFYLFLE